MFLVYRLFLSYCNKFILFSICFRFGKRYELPLLLQSIVMNVMMLAMIQLVVKVKNKNQETRGPDRVFTGITRVFFIYFIHVYRYPEVLVLTLGSFLLFGIRHIRYFRTFG